MLTIESSLLIVTSTSVIALLDIRTIEITQRFQHPLELDVITSVCPSQHWLVVGSATGNLSLWDLRFGLLLKSWHASRGITSIQLHPSRGRGRLVMVSVKRSFTKDSPLMEVYDVETTKLVEVYEIRSTKPNSKSSSSAPTDSVELVPSKSALIAQLAAARLPVDANVTPSVLALMVGQSFASLQLKDEEIGLLMSVPEAKSLPSSSPGWMITAGEDRVVRYWDLAKPSEGFVICGSPKEKDMSFKWFSPYLFDCQTDSTSRQGAATVPTLYYILPNSHRQSIGESRHVGMASQRQPLRPHYDAICALGTVETPFSSCVVSGDRSGVVKVWRMEAGSGTSSRG